MLPTIRAWIIDYKNGTIYLVIWFLIYVCFMLKMVLFMNLYRQQKIIHQRIGQYRSLLINVGASEDLQYTLSEAGMSFGLLKLKVQHFLGTLLS